MVGPVIPDQVGSLGPRIGLGDLADTPGQATHGNPGEVPGQHLARDPIQEAHHPHQGVGAMAVAHLGLTAAHAGPQPASAGLAVEAGLILEEQHRSSRTLPGLSQSLHYSPLFTQYWGSGL